MIKLKIMPRSVFNKRKLFLFIDGKKILKFNWLTNVSLELEELKEYSLNIREGWSKDNFFKIKTRRKSINIYLKRKPVLFGMELIASHDKEFKNIINIEKEI